MGKQEKMQKVLCWATETLSSQEHFPDYSLDLNSNDVHYTPSVWPSWGDSVSPIDGERSRNMYMVTPTKTSGDC